jgi:hypothetical protein
MALVAAYLGGAFRAGAARAPKAKRSGIRRRMTKPGPAPAGYGF